MSQTKTQKRQKALSRLIEEYEKIKDEGRGYYVGNVYYVPIISGRRLRLKIEIETLKNKLGVK